MKTHNLIIYHCIKCGHLMHTEPDAEPPRCCGKQMVNAAAETIHADDADSEEAANERAETERRPFQDRPKPR